MDNYILGWLIFGVVLIVSEFVVPGAILGFLGLAGILVAWAIHERWVSGPVEILTAFFVISIVMITVVRSFFLRIMPGEFKVQNTDEDKDSIGSIVEVMEEIVPEKYGRVKFRDSTWPARSDHRIEAGEKAIITGRDGNNWIVKPSNWINR